MAARTSCIASRMTSASCQVRLDSSSLAISPTMLIALSINSMSLRTDAGMFRMMSSGSSIRLPRYGTARSGTADGSGQATRSCRLRASTRTGSHDRRMDPRDEDDSGQRLPPCGRPRQRTSVVVPDEDDLVGADHVLFPGRVAVHSDELDPLEPVLVFEDFRAGLAVQDRFQRRCKQHLDRIFEDDIHPTLLIHWYPPLWRFVLGSSEHEARQWRSAGLPAQRVIAMTCSFSSY